MEVLTEVFNEFNWDIKFNWEIFRKIGKENLDESAIF